MGDMSRALRIGLEAQPPRFSWQARKRRRIGNESYPRARNRDQVHGFYLGPLPDTGVTDFYPNADHLVWGPEQLRVLAQGPVRPSLVKEVVACPVMAIAHMLDETFLPA